MIDQDDSGSQTYEKRWAADVLDREKLAGFLTRSLSQQVAHLSSQQQGLTVALDAGWGTGKSFFIRHWAADLRQAGHPVVVFDAWENDIGDEAAVALMAGIRSELKTWTNKLSKAKAIQQKANESAHNALKGLRRAIAPTSKVIAAGLLKKATGIAVNEIFDTYQVGASERKSDEFRKATSAVVESGLDDIFERSLEEHHKRGQAILDFKESIGNLITLIKDNTEASLPVFVFVDEVDRCRPPYAIKLLEEIKHIFGVANICYVVSTNLAQLRESVCAVYGAGFDGYGYLRRFFDQHYALPDPDNDSFATLLLSQDSVLSGMKLVPGLPAGPGKPSADRAISLVSTAFAMDLRSQKQVFAVANAAIAALQQNRKVFVLWLFFLCALRHQQPKMFASLSSKRIDQKQFIALCMEALSNDPEIAYMQPSDPYDRQPTQKRTTFSAVIASYYDWSTKDLKQLREKSNETNSYNYPQANINEIAEEMPNQYRPTQKYTPSIATYLELVRYAGLSNWEIREEGSE